MFSLATALTPLDLQAAMVDDPLTVSPETDAIAAIAAKAKRSLSNLSIKLRFSWEIG